MLLLFVINQKRIKHIKLALVFIKMYLLYAQAIISTTAVITRIIITPAAIIAIKVPTKQEYNVWHNTEITLWNSIWHNGINSLQ